MRAFARYSWLGVLALLSAPSVAQTVEPCRAHDDCDDGIYCNGVETCRVGDRSADPRGCLRGEPVRCDDRIACTADRCDEDDQACRHEAPDADSDGHGSAACREASGSPLGDDCDDRDPTRHPGAAEVCDPEGHDEDCDPETVGDRDQDGDGHVDAACWNDLSTFPESR